MSFSFSILIYLLSANTFKNFLYEIKSASFKSIIFLIQSHCKSFINSSKLLSEIFSIFLNIHQGQIYLSIILLSGLVDCV